RAVQDARLFLEGRHRELEASLDAKMRAASETQEYEKAARYRDTLATVEKLSVRQQFLSAGLEEQDYLAHHHDGGKAALQLFQMREGKIQGRREFTFDDLDFDAPSFYAAALAQYYADAVPPPEIYVPALPQESALLERWLGERRGGRVRIKVPSRGVKKRLLDLVARNAALAFEARFRSAHTHGVEVLESLARALGLEEP